VIFVAPLHDGIDWWKSARRRREGVGFYAFIPIYFSFPRPLIPLKNERRSRQSRKKGSTKVMGVNFLVLNFIWLHFLQGSKGSTGPSFGRFLFYMRGAGVKSAFREGLVFRSRQSRKCNLVI
jgi:hypothetical protein